MRSPDALIACTFRRATADDVTALQMIEYDAGRRYASLDETRFCTALPDRSEDEHARVRDDGLALLAEAAGRPIGFVLVLPIDGHAHILELAVLLDQQGIGYGRALIAAAEEWAASQGFSEITLTTFRNVEWNAPFYERLGYCSFDVGPDRLELLGLIADEIAAGLHSVPRVAMRKMLR